MEKIENWYFEDLAQTSSTNDSVLEFLLRCNAPCIVSAAVQTKGRGRLDRKWESADGNLYVSFAYELDTSKIGHYVLLSGLAVLETVKTFAPDVCVEVKWPNDVFVGAKKISGILFEKGPDNYWIMGIGINVARTPKVENPMYQITSLHDFGVQVDRLKVLNVLVKHFDFLKMQYQKHGFSFLKSIWLDNAYNRGKNVIIKQNGKEIEGVLADLDENANLVLNTKEGEKHILVGDLFEGKNE